MPRNARCVLPGHPYHVTQRGTDQRTGHLWQNRFYSCILAGSHVRKELRYVERNPVRAEIAERPEDYRWSSAAAHLAGKDPFGVLDWSEWERLGKAEGWAGLLATPEEREQTRLLRRCTYAGRPFGEEEFLAEMEEQFGRRWRRWGFEGKEMNKIAAAAASA